MVSGIWKVDLHGVLIHLPGPGFHWMTLDAGNRFRSTPLPSGPGGDVARIGVDPTVILASSYPVVIGADGNMYFPSHESGVPVRLMRMLPSGETSIVARLPSTTAGTSLRDLSGLAAGPRGSMYYTDSNAVRRVSRDGRVSTVAENVHPPTCGSVPGLGPADRPLLRGLVVAGDGTAFVAATGCGSVLRVTPEGQVSILFQTEGLWSPTGVAMFGDDLYVLEFLGAASDNRREMVPRIRKITADGAITIIATVTRP